MASTLLPGVADILIRSRNTILEILAERGYNTTPYKNIAPSQLVALAEGRTTKVHSIGALDMVVNRDESAVIKAPCERAIVLYNIFDTVRSKIDTFLQDLFDETPYTKDDDIMVIINEPYNEVFDKVSLQQWQTHRSRLRFFHIKHLVVNPGKHVLVPPHRKLTPEESADEIKKLHVTAKSQFPLIKHSDIQARLLGLVPGDLVEVRRPSATAGVARLLRICVA